MIARGRHIAGMFIQVPEQCMDRAAIRVDRKCFAGMAQRRRQVTFLLPAPRLGKELLYAVFAWVLRGMLYMHVRGCRHPTDRARVRCLVKCHAAMFTGN